MFHLNALRQNFALGAVIVALLSTLASACTQDDYQCNLGATVWYFGKRQ